MAIYHLSTKIVSRGSGRSAVGAAAYRSGEKLKNERDGIEHDFTRKSHIDKESSQIFTPDGAPEWMQDREKLWNKVEQVNGGKKAQLAREMDVALPVELNLEQQRELAREFGNALASEGMVVDLNLHLMKDNPHMDIMMTMNPINDQGEFGAKQRKVYKLDKNGNKIYDKNKKTYKCTTEKTTDWDEKGLDRWRLKWEVLANKALEKAGHEARIDRRTNKARGIEEKPTIHIGVAAEAMERKNPNYKHPKKQYNRDVVQLNKQLREARKERQRLWEEKKSEPEKRSMTVREIMAAARTKRHELLDMQSIAESKLQHVEEKQTEFLSRYKDDAIREAFQPRVDDLEMQEEAIRENKANLIRADKWLAENKPGFFDFSKKAQYKEMEAKHDANIAKHTAWIESYTRDKAALAKDIATARNSPMNEKVEAAAKAIAKKHKPEEMEKFSTEIKQISKAVTAIGKEVSRFEKLEQSLKPKGLSQDRAQKALERPLSVQMSKTPIEGTRMAADALKGILNSKAVGGGGGPKLDAPVEIDWEWLQGNPAALEAALAQVKDRDEGIGR